MRSLLYPVGTTSIMACRFCFDESATNENPLLSPCDCRGSIQFIHRECLRHWRSVSDNPQLKTHCQLCGSLFVVLRKWPYEALPDEAVLQSRTWQFLSKPLYGVLFVYYIQILYILLNINRLIERALPDLEPRLRPIIDPSSLQLVLPNSRVASLILELTEVQIVLLVVLGIVTAAYARFYGQLVWRVQNKKMYFKYFFSPFELERTIVPPLLWLSLTIIIFVLSILIPFPCVVFYVALLPYYMRIHCEILHDMNRRGEAL